VKRPKGVSVVGRIEAELRRRGSPERAEGAKRYLKSELTFIGTDTRTVREAASGVLRELAPLNRAGLLALVRDLWRRGIFELRALAVELLKARSTVLVAGDHRLIERLIRDSQTWAFVDFLSIQVAGPLVVRLPDLSTVLDRWAADRDLWVRRAAMLALLLPIRRGGGDFERFARYADGMLEEEEFFIRKAIGWVLRETGKKRPHLVDAWLAPRIGRASGVTVREAVRYLPQARREALMAAYRERRPATTRAARAGETGRVPARRKGG
jgi:3-methyladenine DNA glycosylase AlkD